MVEIDNHVVSIPKPVILLNIDSLMPQPLEIAMQTGRAPALKFLMEQGRYIANMVTSFPTMSVTIDSSLLTGTYADKHHIPGLNWFDTEQNQFVNYGTGFRETFRMGMKKSIHHMLYNLNNVHLSEKVSTIYEELARIGLSSASINSFVYRGNKLQQLKIPKFLRTFTYFEDGKWTMKVPSIFSLGLFSKLRPVGFTAQLAAGNYKYMARELRYLIHKQKLPAFTFCIFQDMDARIHFKGPMDIKGIIKIDRQIQKMLNMFDSWEEAVNSNIWMIIGDNGHSATGTKYRDYIIDLRKLLNNYRIVRIQRAVHKKDELAICVNQRMAYVYMLDHVNIGTIVEKLKHDKRIDIIAWKENDCIRVESAMKEGTLYFRPNGKYVDEFNQSWWIVGNHELLDLKWIENHIVYNDFPDALARLHGALYSHPGQFLVVNAKPGCEFKAQSTPFHLSGAAHGSLHKQESIVPLIIVGTNEQPITPRIIDLKEFIFRVIQEQLHE